MTDATPTDAEILDAVHRGDPEAFEAFVARYGRRLLAFGQRMCGHREDAEDVLQETLIKAFRGLDRLRDPGAVRTWLFRVAANECLMKRRKQAPASEREIALDDLKPPGWDEGRPADVPDWTALPEDVARRAELREVLARALLELPAEARAAVVLRDIEGLTTEEAARALGIGVSALKMRLNRARLALRRRLESYCHAAGLCAPAPGGES